MRSLAMSRNLLVAVIGCYCLASCGRQSNDNQPAVQVTAELRTGAKTTAAGPVTTSVQASAVDDAKAVQSLVAAYSAPTKQDRYDAAFHEVLGYLADKKYARALAALEDAKAIHDTEQVRHEIDRTRDLIAQQAAVEHTASNAR